MAHISHWGLAAPLALMGWDPALTDPGHLHKPLWDQRLVPEILHHHHRHLPDTDQEDSSISHSLEILSLEALRRTDLVGLAALVVPGALVVQQDMAWAMCNGAA